MFGETRPFSRDEVGSEMCAREIAARVRWYLSASGRRIFIRLLISKSLNSKKNREILKEKFGSNKSRNE